MDQRGRERNSKGVPTFLEEILMSQPLAAKTALVTGGSRGIGRSIAERLAKEGATVALTYNASKDGAEETVAAIEKAGGSAFALHADLVDAASIPALFEQLDHELTRRTGGNALDILVNNAGNSGWGGLADATPQTWDTMFAVQARAPFFVVQSALSRLSDGARIVNVSSAAGSRPMAAAPIYSMAKASINNLTHTLAIELGPRGITVNAVAPGWVRTDMNTAVRENAGMVAAIEAETALGRFGDAAEIASVVTFLSSGEARWVTGQVIEASGGYKL
ncbi:SDR family NAD(P)-dependent oxidoreductase [Actinoplanes sp. NPDC000266]